MSAIADLKMLYHLTCAPIRGATHAERMESFYSGQADGYDRFRQRLLPGRAALIEALHLPPGGVWLDLGAGTGGNLEFAGPRVEGLARIYLVDLCAALLRVARERVADRSWKNVEVVLEDATRFVPPEPVDLVTFSFSLTMIPDWFRAIDRALESLKPGGCIGVTDFFVSRKHVAAGAPRHGWLTRSLLPLWFGRDNVHLSRDHVAYLHDRFECVEFFSGHSSIPYLPFVRAPYYRFIGRKR